MDSVGGLCHPRLSPAGGGERGTPPPDSRNPPFVYWMLEYRIGGRRKFHKYRVKRLNSWVPAFAGMEIMEIREYRMEGSARNKDKGATDQAGNATNLVGKLYSVGKVRMPAGLSNRLPADTVLSIVLMFWVCQGENDTFFGGLKYQDWREGEV